MLFDPKKTARGWALYLIEAIFKSNSENSDLIIKTLHLSTQVEWAEVNKILNADSESNLAELLSFVRKSSDSAERICLVEEDFDVFFESYRTLSESMDDNFQYDHPGTGPETRLKEILVFSNQFGIPRVKLRLLLEFTALAELFDSNDISFLEQAFEEIEATLARMPDGATTQIDGSWFYGRGVQDIRDFLDSYWDN